MTVNYSRGGYFLVYDKEIYDIFDDLKIFQNMYEKIRFVDPLRKKVLLYKDGKLEEFDSNCYDTWNKNKLCMNCISMRSYNENKTFVKMEHDKSEIYMVTSIPVKLADRNIVIELFKDATLSMASSDPEESLQINMYSTIDSMNEILLKDTLVKVYNRRYINEVLPVEITISEILSTSLWVIIADIDFFKKVNDTYGHLAGDSVLKEFAKILERCIEGTNGWIARYGGEEFLISINNATKEELKEIVENMRKSVEKHTFYYENVGIKITSSFGISNTNEIENLNMFSLIDNADKKLYLAKDKGRNRVEI